MPVQEQAIENWSITSSKEEIKPKAKEMVFWRYEWKKKIKNYIATKRKWRFSFNHKVGIIYHPTGLQNLIRILV